jgi:hypothetical protein
MKEIVKLAPSKQSIKFIVRSMKIFKFLLTQTLKNLSRAITHRKVVTLVLTLFFLSGLLTGWNGICWEASSQERMTQCKSGTVSGFSTNTMVKIPRRGQPNRRSITTRYWTKLIKKSGYSSLYKSASGSIGSESLFNVIGDSALTEWESHMMLYGSNYCAKLIAGEPDGAEILADVYYDGAFVYHQIKEYTNNSDWDECTNAALKVYQNDYVLPNSGVIPGYWNFSDGILSQYTASKDPLSLQSLYLLSHNASFASESTKSTTTLRSTLSREVSYLIISYLNFEKAQKTNIARLDLLVDQALGHLDQWFASENSPHVRSFMVGLTARSLIRYWEKTGDARIVPALAFSLEKLWQLNWVESEESFRYQNVPVTREPFEEGDGTEATPSLNLLIAPAYAWVAAVTGDAVMAERSDKIFRGGVNKAFLDNPKQFNQNYLWSFDYVKWRKDPKSVYSTRF